MRFYATSELRTDRRCLSTSDLRSGQNMKAPRTRLSLAAIAISAFFATPVAAATVEEAVVPPSNSAATQDTGTFPASGGNKKTDQKPSHRSPAKALGTRHTQKLQKQGPETKAATDT